MAREIRYARFEDWKGNIYRLEGSSGNGAGGDISIDVDNIGGPESGSTNNTDGTHTGDPEANDGSAIIVVSGSEDKNAATVYFDNISFGMWSVGIRAKCNIVGNETDILQINCYYVDNTEANPTVLLRTQYVKASQFFDAGSYTEIGCSIVFNGVYTTSVSLKVEIILLKNTGATITIDNITLYKSALYDFELNDWSINAPQTRTVYKLQNRVKLLEETVVRKSDVVNNLTSDATNVPLSAKQGKTLQQNINNLSNTVTNINSTLGSHGHPAGKITDGTLAGRVNANAAATANLGNSQVRNIHAGTGTPTSLTSGAIYIQY